mmetsp:Transcript_32074/g.62724  ORF Transcript_32074/g.62724 Transcript_32074/m.62724 type:complete len:747 (+) Transcript_32074:133-2373(+)
MAEDLFEQIRMHQREAQQKAKQERKAGGEGGGNGKGSGGGKGKEKSLVEIALTIPVLLFLMYMTSSGDQNGPEITWQEFANNYLAAQTVSKVAVVNRNEAVVYLKSDPAKAACHFLIGSVDSFERQMEDVQNELGFSTKSFIPIQYVTSTSVLTEIGKMAPQLLILGVWIFIIYRFSSGGGLGGMGGGGGARNIFSIGKSKAQKFNPEDGGTKVKFKDVAGLDEAKVEVMEFVKFLQNPERFTRLGAKIPKGALLVGPPGTGKTLLAKATAGEASVPFFSMSGSDFIEMFVGVGPSRVRDLFKEARAEAPCIVFIDEIDAVGRARGKGGMSGGNDERENTLNQLLVEMDGFTESEGVVVLAGTNRADILDSALLRPGRFDRQITIDKPDIRGREQIFRVHLKPLKLGHEPKEVASRLAALTPGFAGADIANICNEAALIAAREDANSVMLIHFEKAVDRVIGGIEKPNGIMNLDEKKLVAYHEAGHAVVGWFLEHADPLLKVTIVPRGLGALGFAQYLPKEVSLYHAAQLNDMMCMALGGRAAEQVFFGKISTGASDDLKKVTNIAYSKVMVYGMSKKLANMSYQPQEGDNQFQKPYSDATATAIDQEVNTLIKDLYSRTIALVKEKKSEVEALAEKLLEVETINHDQIVEVLGDRPYTTPAYQEYVKNQIIKMKQEASAGEGEGEGEGNDNEVKHEEGVAKDGEAKEEIEVQGSDSSAEKEKTEPEEQEEKEKKEKNDGGESSTR